jgi:hypothetical protein
MSRRGGKNREKEGNVEKRRETWRRGEKHREVETYV